MKTMENHITEAYLKRLKTDSEKELIDLTTDFFTKYYAIYHLQTVVQQNPGFIEPETIGTIRKVFEDARFSHQRQALFFFRNAAEILTLVMIHSHDRRLADLAFSTLKDILAATNGPGHQATVEAMSSLPLSISGPDIRDVKDNDVDDVPRVTWPQILDAAGVKTSVPPVCRGRSLVVAADGNAYLLVVKLARADNSSTDLLHESLWMEHLRGGRYSFAGRFNIPEPVKIKSSYIFSLAGLPVKLSKKLNLHPKGYAIGFIADRDYFAYPNDSGCANRLDHSEFTEVMLRNARLLGKLSSFGIVHGAPIALFHNRIQIGRRRDGGQYEWIRGGRLDRWLASCSYPNLGPTGIRDFEHLVTVNGQNRHFYRYIGNHILSLLLIAGSYFRNRVPEMVGLDPEERPVDARHLFDEHALKEIIRGILSSYYQGFTGLKFSDDLPFDPDQLAGRMIEEMGVDRHMEEVIRVVDQNEMTEAEFRSLLKDGSLSEDVIATIPKGAGDVVVRSGPHLGGFNRPISLPEIIEAVGSMSALSIAGKYRAEAFGENH
jgi:hypothetical protein